MILTSQIKEQIASILRDHRPVGVDESAFLVHWGIVVEYTISNDEDYLDLVDQVWDGMTTVPHKVGLLDCARSQLLNPMDDE